MNLVRTCLAPGALAIALAFLAACASSTPEERAQATELDGLASLKQTYSGVVMGFDFKPGDTLVVSLDVDGYNGMDDDRQAAMKRAVLERWRTLWAQAHPHEHAIVRVRFADFIGRTWAEESAPV